MKASKDKIRNGSHSILEWLKKYICNSEVFNFYKAIYIDLEQRVADTPEEPADTPDHILCR